MKPKSNPDPLFSLFPCSYIPPLLQEKIFSESLKNKKILGQIQMI